MMPAGKYYVGDLCYVMHPEWDEFCKITISGNECLQGEFNLADGRRFATFTTAYGDGEYRSNQNTSHSVDAGLIGCIRIEDIRDPEATEAAMRSLGAIVEFDRPFECSGGRRNNWDGVIHFGNLQIFTGDEECEELEEEEEEYE